MTVRTKLEQVEQLIASVDRELSLTVAGSVESEILSDQMVHLLRVRSEILTEQSLRWLMGEETPEVHTDADEPEWEEGYDEPREDQFRDDVEADADTLASAGWGTDEDYGYYGDGEY